MKKIIKVTFALLLFLAGCSQKPVITPKLKQAHIEFQKIKKDADINTDAQLQLLKATVIYEDSKRTKSENQADHLAFMLQKQIDLAQEVVKAKVLEKKISDLKEIKSKALLDQKQSELLLMEQEKQNAKEEARLAREKIMALQELNALQTNRGLVLTLGDVLFETGKSNLLAGSVRAIEKLAEFLQDNPERQVIIEGHTDNVGSSTYNLDLSLRRSMSVKNALIQKDIDSTRLLVKGYGETYPVAGNIDAGGRQRNRRVEIVILEEGVNPDEMVRENQD